MTDNSKSRILRRLDFDTDDAARDFGQALGDEVRSPILGYLGRSSDQQIRADEQPPLGVGQPFMVWVRIGNNPEATVARFRGADLTTLTYDAPVELKERNSRYYVMGSDFDEGAAYFGTPPTTTTVVTQESIQIGLLRATSPPSMVMEVKAASYHKVGQGSYYVGALETEDFSTSPLDVDSVAITLPAVGKAIAVLIEIDPENGTLHYKQSAEFDVSITIRKARKLGLVPTVTNSRARVGYIRLLNGMSEITGKDNVLPEQQLISYGGSGAPADAPYIVATPNADLPNAQALDALATGLLYNTAGTLSKATSAQVVAGIDDGALPGAKIQNSSISGIDKLISGSVTEDKIGTGAVTSGKIDTGAVTSTKIGTGAVTVGKLGTGAVTTTTIADANVTNTKIAAFPNYLYIMALGANPTINTTTFTDINAVLSTTTIFNAAKRVLVSGNFELLANANNVVMQTRVMLGGAQYVQLPDLVCETGFQNYPFSFTVLVQLPSAGSHTIKLQWARFGAAVLNMTRNIGQFFVIELP